jgi:hypothetical protein
VGGVAVGGVAGLEPESLAGGPEAGWAGEGAGTGGVAPGEALAAVVPRGGSCTGPCRAPRVALGSFPRAAVGSISTVPPGSALLAVDGLVAWDSPDLAPPGRPVP